jgi:hypothetical protein
MEVIKTVNKQNKSKIFGKFNNKNFDNVYNIKFENKEMTEFINIICINIASLNNKYDIMKTILQEIKKHFQIIDLQETRIVTNENKVNNLIDNYNTIIINPKLNKCGGMIIFIRNDISYTIKTVINTLLGLYIGIQR